VRGPAPFLLPKEHSQVNECNRLFSTFDRSPARLNSSARTNPQARSPKVSIHSTTARTVGHFTVSLIGVLFWTNLSSAQDYGSISGTVVDESGKSVQGASVYAHPMDRPMASIIPHATTDGSGSFTISMLDYGRYSVSAAKPDEGYPELYLAFYAGLRASLPVVRLSAKHQFASVALTLGSKAGILTGTVADAVTGKPLNANVEFRWALEPRNFLRGSGLTNAEFRILVPSNHPVTMVVSLESYENWRYQTDKSPLKNAILLRPGEELHLDIRLWPSDSRQTSAWLAKHPD
jgi:Carboxypeptidase regulatory-like domain